MVHWHGMRRLNTELDVCTRDFSGPIQEQQRMRQKRCNRTYQLVGVLHRKKNEAKLRSKIAHQNAAENNRGSKKITVSDHQQKNNRWQQKLTRQSEACAAIPPLPIAVVGGLEHVERPRLGKPLVVELVKHAIQRTVVRNLE